MIFVSIVEDDLEIRESLSELIDSAEGFRCVGAYPSCENAIKGVQENKPDLILMDIGLPGMSGIECIRVIKEIYPDLNIIVLTSYQDEKRVFNALVSGACGYLTKNTEADKILESIQEAHEGGAPMSANIARMVVESFKIETVETGLTKREKEVLKFLCEGHSYKMIADDMTISIDTVHTHIKRIYKKLHVNSKSEAVIKAIRENIIKLD